MRLADFRQGVYRSDKLFDDVINLLALEIPSACGIYGHCQSQIVIEGDGSVYPCDFIAWTNIKNVSILKRCEMDKKVTIREVAALAGVSISSVSRYLANPTSVQPSAAYKIKMAITDLNYEPCSAAQNLKRARSNTVGIIVPNAREFFGTIASLVTDFFFQRDLMAIVCVTGGDEQKERYFIQEMIKQKAAGIMIAPVGKNMDYLTRISQTYRNIVVIDRQEEFGRDIVMENHLNNAYQLVVHQLKKKSYDHILFLHGYRGSCSTRMCIQGSLKAMEETGYSEENVDRIMVDGKMERVQDALACLMQYAAPGKQLLLVAFGNDVLEYSVMGLQKQYSHWKDHCDICGFALPGAKEKLGLDCSLVIKNPLAEGAKAAELLYSLISDSGLDRAPAIHEVKSSFEFV